MLSTVSSNLCARACGDCRRATATDPPDSNANTTTHATDALTLIFVTMILMFLCPPTLRRETHGGGIIIPR